MRARNCIPCRAHNVGSLSFRDPHCRKDKQNGLTNWRLND